MQIDALKAAGCTKIFREKESGAKRARPELEKCLAYLRDDDVLVVWKLDRLARSMKQLVEIVENLRERGIGFKVLTGADIDTTSSSGRLVFGIFAALAEFERKLISERVKAGIAAAKSDGKKFGRPRIGADQVADLRRRLLSGQSWRSIAKETRISVASISRYRKKLAEEDQSFADRIDSIAMNGRRAL